MAEKPKTPENGNSGFDPAEILGNLELAEIAQTYLLPYAGYIVIGLIIGALVLIGQQINRHNAATGENKQTPLQTLGQAFQFQTKEDTTPLIPKLPWTRLRNLYIVAAAAAIPMIWPLNWNIPLAVIVIFLLPVTSKRYKSIKASREHTLNQLFVIAQACLRYGKGADQVKEQYVQITEWKSGVVPQEATVMYPPSAPVSKDEFRQEFEMHVTSQGFAGIVWDFEWDFPNNLVRMTAQPPLPTMAYLPFPTLGQFAWNQLPLGIGIDGEPIFWDPTSAPHAAISGRSGQGKATDIRTPVPTPSGWTTMGELEVGDKVFDEKGRACGVTWVSDVNENPDLYEVEFSDGSVIRADAQHLWKTTTSAERRNDSQHRTVGPKRQRKFLLDVETVDRIRFDLETDCLPEQMTYPEVCDYIGVSRSNGWVRKLCDGHGPVGYDTIISLTYGGTRSIRRDVNTFDTRLVLTSVLEHASKPLNDQRSKMVSTEGAVRTTQEIMETLLDKHGKVNHAIEVAGTLQLPHRDDLLIDPYMLGVWLGDGSSRKGMFYGIDHEIADRVRDSYPDLIGSVQDTCANADFRIWRSRLLTNDLRLRGLLQSSTEQGSCKYIPDEYMRSSEQQRRDLLAGLLDTDGTISPQGATHFDNTNEYLASQVRELALSLGYRATLTSGIKRSQEGTECVSYRVSFTTCDPVFYLPRKALALIERTQNYTPARNTRRYIVDVRPVDPVPARCIAVDSPSRLFLVGPSMIPTHNSVTQRNILLHVLQSPEWNALLLDPKRVELSQYRNADGVIRYAVSEETMNEALEFALEEMSNRYTIMEQQGVAFYRKLPSPPKAILVMIDEAASLLLETGDKEIDVMKKRNKVIVGRLAREGRAAGVHLVMATQRPDARWLGGDTRETIEARVAMGNMSSSASLMILNNVMATRTPGIKGRGIYFNGNDYEPFQSYFFDDSDVPQAIPLCNQLRDGSMDPEKLRAMLYPDGDEPGVADLMGDPSRKGFGKVRFAFEKWLRKLREAAEARGEDDDDDGDEGGMSMREVIDRVKTKRAGKKPPKDEVVKVKGSSSGAVSPPRPPRKGQSQGSASGGGEVVEVEDYADYADFYGELEDQSSRHESSTPVAGPGPAAPEDARPPGVGAGWLEDVEIDGVDALLEQMKRADESGEGR